MTWINFRSIGWKYSILMLLSIALSLLSAMGGAMQPRPALAQERPPEFEFEGYEFWVDQCRLLLNADEYEKVIEACERAIELKPKRDNFYPWSARSEALFFLGQYPEAIASFNRVLEVTPQDSVALAYQCASLFNLNEYLEALDTCEIALRIDGSWGDRSPAFAWYYRGLALEQLGRLETAIASYRRALIIDPDDIASKAGLCALAVQLGQFDLCNLVEAVVAYERSLDGEPEDADLWLQQGFALEQRGEYERALVSYTRAVELTPDNSVALAHQCAIQINLTDYEAAVAACEQALKGDHNWGNLGSFYGWVQLSGAQIGTGDYEAAIASVARAIDIEPKYPPAWNNRAVVLWHLGHYPEAQVAIERAQLAYQIAELAYGETFERPYLESPILFYRSWVLTHFNQGRIFSAQQDFMAAAQAYQRAIDLDRVQSEALEVKLTPDLLLAKIYSNQSIAYLYGGDFRAAAEASANAVRLDNLSFAAWYNRGLVLYQSERYAEAWQAYRRAELLDPESIYAITGQGLALLDIGCVRAAFNTLDRALNIDPSYALASQTRDQLLVQQSELGDEGVVCAQFE